MFGQKSLQEMRHYSHGAGPAADGALFVAVSAGGVVEAEQFGSDAEREAAKVVLGRIGAEGRCSSR